MNHLTIPLAHTERFSLAAQQYEHHARVQRHVAAHLWNWAHSLLQGDSSAFAPQACVDVGCGTGFLTDRMLKHYPQLPVHAVDMAPGMLAALQSKHPDNHQLHTHCLNGETLSMEHLWIPPHSLLMSSMCAQWFDDLEGAVRRWLSVSNTVAFSVLLDGSFQVWKAAHEETGQTCGLRALPTAAQLEQLIHKLVDEGLVARSALHEKEFLDHHTDGLSFARSLRFIGADQPHATHQPVQLRKVIRALGGACTLNYHLGFYCLERA